MKIGITFLALLLFGAAVDAQTVASCPTATPGATWSGSTQWLQCAAPAAYIAQPIPATAIINDMRCSTTVANSCVWSWQLPSGVLSTDQVWVKTTAIPAGTWVKASTLTFAAATSTPAPTANGMPSAAILTWVAPTTYTDGKTIAAPLTYNVYRGSSATSLTKLTNVSALTYTDPAGSATATTYFYAVTATCAACTESVLSSIVSTTIAAAAAQPGVPTSVATH